MRMRGRQRDRKSEQKMGGRHELFSLFLQPLFGWPDAVTATILSPLVGSFSRNSAFSPWEEVARGLPPTGSGQGRRTA